MIRHRSFHWLEGTFLALFLSGCHGGLTSTLPDEWVLAGGLAGGLAAGFFFLHRAVVRKQDAEVRARIEKAVSREELFSIALCSVSQWPPRNQELRDLLAHKLSILPPTIALLADNPPRTEGKYAVRGDGREGWNNVSVVNVEIQPSSPRGKETMLILAPGEANPKSLEDFIREQAVAGKGNLRWSAPLEFSTGLPLPRT